MSNKTYDDGRRRVAEAVSEFPGEFGLRGFPGERFRINPQTSYVNDSGTVMLYTDVWKIDRWLSFAKGTADELNKEVVK